MRDNQFLSLFLHASFCSVLKEAIEEAHLSPPPPSPPHGADHESWVGFLEHEMSVHVTSSLRNNNNNFSNQKKNNSNHSQRQQPETLKTKAQNFLLPSFNTVQQSETKRVDNEKNIAMHAPSPNTYINLPSAAQILSGGHRGGAIGGGGVGGDIMPLSSNPRKFCSAKTKARVWLSVASEFMGWDAPVYVAVLITLVKTIAWNLNLL